MDWGGQNLSEQLMQYMMLVAALISFLTGYFLSSYRLMLLTYVSSVAITFLVTVPDWFFFNRHLLEWAGPISTDAPSSKRMKLRIQEQQAVKKPVKPVPAKR